MKNGATLLSGTVIAQGIVFLTYPIVARLYTPEDFGMYTLILSYIDIFVILCTGRYEQALMMARNETEIWALTKLCRRVSLMVSACILLGTGIVFFMGGIEEKTHALGALIFFIPLLVFFTARYKIYSAVFNKYKAFKQIAFSDVVGNVSGTLLKIVFGCAHLWRTGLPLATLLGRILGNFNYGWKLRQIAQPKILRPQWYAVARQYKNFPLYSMPKDFINSFSANLPFLLLAMYFDASYLGLFAMALTFTFRPVSLLNSAYERILYERVSSKFLNRQPFSRDIYRFLGLNYAVFVPLFCAVFIFAKPIFIFILGAEWGESALYFRYLLPWVLVMLSSSSLSFIPNIFSTQRTEVILYIILFVIRLGVLFLGIYFRDFVLAIALFCIVGVLFTLSLLGWYVFQIQKYEKGLKKS